MRTVLQALLQDEVSLEKIYERFAESETIPRREDEAGLTSALVDGFERWVRGEAGAEASNSKNLSDVALNLASQHQQVVAA